MPTFLPVADGKTVVASRLKLEAFTIFFVSEGGTEIKMSVLFRFKLRKLELSYDIIDVKSVSLLK